jgi:hypothetical protein
MSIYPKLNPNMGDPKNLPHTKNFLGRVCDPFISATACVTAFVAGFACIADYISSFKRGNQD